MRWCVSFRYEHTPIGGEGETGGLPVSYYFQFPKQVFGGDSSVCCSKCFDFTGHVEPADANAAGEHFHQCYTAMTKLGFLIDDEFVLSWQETKSDDEVLAKRFGLHPAKTWPRLRSGFTRRTGLFFVP